MQLHERNVEQAVHHAVLGGRQAWRSKWCVSLFFGPVSLPDPPLPTGRPSAVDDCDGSGHDTHEEERKSATGYRHRDDRALVLVLALVLVQRSSLPRDAMSLEVVVAQPSKLLRGCCVRVTCCSL